MPLPRLSVYRFAASRLAISCTSRSAITRIPLIATRGYSNERSPKDFEDFIPKGVPLFKWEEHIIAFLNQYPGATKFYTNPDGTIRVPTDEEFKSLALLRQAILQGNSTLSASDFLKLDAGERASYLESFEQVKSKLAGDLDLSEGKVVDKVPVKDGKTGEVFWEVVRVQEKEGWERLIYYGYIPVLAFLTLYYAFGTSNDIKQWALEELRLQTEEKYLKDNITYNSQDPKLEREKHVLLAERLLAGEFDKLVSH
ncbi:hypothetical protein V1514DRAFT_335176 [Lipomyces japonicus]|uniref:uncharacterized protein n=1 Tax=Lipomyces japonicus TaxID=56871 RepID=UPI0034CF32A0